jgi:hypothetical protein
MDPTRRKLLVHVRALALSFPLALALEGCTVRPRHSKVFGEIDIAPKDVPEFARIVLRFAESNDMRRAVLFGRVNRSDGSPGYEVSLGTSDGAVHVQFDEVRRGVFSFDLTSTNTETQWMPTWSALRTALVAAGFTVQVKGPSSLLSK